MITPALFKIRFPEFVSITDARVQMFIDDSVVVLNETYWGEKYDMGLHYYTAHLLSIGINSENGNSGSIAPVASKSVDGVSISYSNAASNNKADEFLSSTAYGQRYMALRKTLGVSACVI